MSPSRNIPFFNSYTASHFSQFSSSDSYFYFHFTLTLYLSTQMSVLCHCQSFAKHSGFKKVRLVLPVVFFFFYMTAFALEIVEVLLPSEFHATFM